MDWFVLALDASLSRAQRVYLQQVLQQVAQVYIDDLEDPAFRQWVAHSVHT